MDHSHSIFDKSPDIIPPLIKKGMSISDLINLFGQTSFEARNLYRGARLYQRMLEERDVVWLGIAGAGIAGGMGGMVISLLESGFIDVICSTGAQVYHDLHFAFDLPVKSISPYQDDELLRRHGDTRIYDIGIRETETLEAQDEIIRTFVKESHAELMSGQPISSWMFNYILGNWVLKKSKYPQRSFIACAAKHNVPVFWDSLANHSIAMNLVLTDRQGFPVTLSAQKDIITSAAIVYASPKTGFLELGGGGPKNFIQQTGPTISQILQISYDGADRGLQISTANEKEGSLSGCTFSESVTWGKYRTVDQERLVQIWGEYSIILPILSAYVIDTVDKKPAKEIISQLSVFVEKMEKAG